MHEAQELDSQFVSPGTSRDFSWRPSDGSGGDKEACGHDHKLRGVEGEEIAEMNRLSLF